MAPTSWEEIGVYVEKEVAKIEKLEDHIAGINTAIAVVQQRVTIWGALASALALISGPVGALCWWFLSQHASGSK